MVVTRDAITNLPGYRYVFEMGTAKDSWDVGASRRSLELGTEFYSRPERGPVATLSDLRLQLVTRHAAPQPIAEYREGGQLETGSTLEDWAFLVPWTAVTEESLRQERSWRAGERRVETVFYWPPPPKGIVAGYTAPVQAWVETRLEGFTTVPMVLQGEYSQTYHPGHHNFFEEFLFDPWLEPGVTAAQLAELQAANIRAILCTHSDGFPAPVVAVLGWDGKFRVL
ncbi:MAG: hypothetical protein L6Q38_18640 [Nitrospira sp.]|nr:hypothetical protein [Nitrospira sp.]